MLVLQWIGGILGVILVFFLYSFINIATKDKYGFPLLSVKILLTVYADSQLFVWGDYWYTSAVKEKGDTLNGIVIFILGALLALGLLIFFYKKFKLVVGTIATLIYGSLLFILVFIGTASATLLLFALMIFMIIGFIFMPYGDPVHITNTKEIAKELKKQLEQENKESEEDEEEEMIISIGKPKAD